MRRKDRETVDQDRIEEIISSCCCCRLGLNDNGRVYIVPLNFGYAENNGRYTFYFHGAKEGRKIELIRRNHYAGFEMDVNYQLKEAGSPCAYSAAFQSIIGAGAVHFVEDTEEKIFALQKIMQHNTGKENWEFNPKMLEHVCVFQLEAEELTCKEHL